MDAITLTVTDAGRAALINAKHSGTNEVLVSHIAITDTVFDPKDAMEKLPGEIKRVDTFSGETVAPDTIHVTILDESSDSYTVRGFGLYLDTGVLFGYYWRADPVMEKSAQAILLLSVDIRFTTVDATTITFGDATFTNPPATIERLGVVRLASDAHADGGVDDRRAITPVALHAAMLPRLARKAELKHRHILDDVIGLNTALDNKAERSHIHGIGDIDGLQPALDAKTPFGHRHGMTDIDGLPEELSQRLGNAGDQWLRGMLTIDSGAPSMRLRNANDGAIRSVHHNEGTIGFLGSDGGWKVRVFDNGDVWTPMYGFLRDHVQNQVNGRATWDWVNANFTPRSSMTYGGVGCTVAIWGDLAAGSVTQLSQLPGSWLVQCVASRNAMVGISTLVRIG